MTIKKLVWIFVFICLVSSVAGEVVNSDSWDTTLYSFNKTFDGTYIADDCDTINYDVWYNNFSTFVANGTCNTGNAATGHGIVLTNTNHSFDLINGIVVEIGNFKDVNYKNDVSGIWISNNTYGAYALGGVGGPYDVWGICNAFVNAECRFGTWTTGNDNFPIGYDIQINLTTAGGTFIWHGEREQHQAGSYTSNTNNMYILWGFLSAGSQAMQQLDYLIAYPSPSKVLVNFTVYEGGAAKAGANITFYNSTDQSIIDAALTDGNGLARLNLSKGGGGFVHGGYPHEITVVIIDSGSILVNETVVAAETKGIYPGDVFNYSMEGEAVYINSVTLDSPVDNTHNNSFINNYCYTPNFNMSIITCQLFTNETGSFVSEEIDAGVNNGSLNCFNHNIAVDGTFDWNVYCTVGAPQNKWAAANYTLVIDTEDPDITISDSINNSKYISTDYLNPFFVCSDEYVYNMEFIVYNSTNANVSYAYNSTASGNTLTLNKNISLAAYGDSTYTINYSCSDSHTDKDWNPLLSISEITGGVLVEVDGKDKLEIKIKNVEGGDLDKIKTIKIKDRLLFNLTFTSFITAFEYEIKADSIVEYNSPYYSHLILNDKYWWDSNPYPSEIIEIKDGKATIRVSGLYTDKLVTESLGGLNVVTLQSTFIVDNTAPAFSGLGTNTTQPLIERYLLMFGTIQDDNPDYYRFAWNASGTMTNITSPAVYTDGENVTLSQLVNASGTQCFQIWANDTFGNSVVSADQCFNVTPYKVHITIYNEGSGAVITANVTVRFTSIYDEFQEITETGTLISDLITSAEYVVLFTSEGYSPRTYTITVGNDSITYLTAYLTQNTSTTIFTVIDKDTAETIPDVLCTMYRTINGSWQVVESRFSDVTGRAQFTYEGNANYKFFFDRADYDGFVFYLTPILYSSYDVDMSKTTLRNYSQDFDGVSLIYAPQSFPNDDTTTFNFIITSPNGLLTGYGINLTYPGGTSASSGSNAIGGQLSLDINITGASAFDTVRMNYYYETSLSGRRNFTVYMPIEMVDEDLTWLHNKDVTYGLGIFEIILIVTIILLFVVGIATLIGQPIAGFALGIVVLAYMVSIGFVPIWLALPSILVGLFFLMWKSGGL